ncbi:hypothetical protein EZV62_027180 [Acer yangbiense]|uniref:Uncharacterized protein n=1 Tax=Acer yangbiense TaxID=1000413 RepID=A0A5C7GUV3_9ROSI|nr:hypothetical protein EZV62_027180 [Acer yangbiense]
MEGGYKMSMTFTIYIMVLLAFVTFGAADAVEDVGGIAPSPMEIAGAALGVPAFLAAIASLLACYFFAECKFIVI